MVTNDAKMDAKVAKLAANLALPPRFRQVLIESPLQHEDRSKITFLGPLSSGGSKEPIARNTPLLNGTLITEVASDGICLRGCTDLNLGDNFSVEVPRMIKILEGNPLSI
ncbi:hypothetical protein TNCV_3358551 [Trichonephila clavipes]|nr:hypothetical protein TNCV_3358551 [Trichonephila clavipes]